MLVTIVDGEYNDMSETYGAEVVGTTETNIYNVPELTVCSIDDCWKFMKENSMTVIHNEFYTWQPPYRWIIDFDESKCGYPMLMVYDGWIE